MESRTYHLFMPIEDGTYQQVDGVYDDADKETLHRAFWNRGISPKFRIISRGESTDSTAGSE